VAEQTEHAAPVFEEFVRQAAQGDVIYHDDTTVKILTLTLFLRVPGAPLDNNICERALKMAIRHRKNSLFYKTTRGARVGDIFMSLIHTCRLCGANSFDYLTELERHTEEVASNPGDWMPWNYRQTLAAATAEAPAAR
jgi:hypothetical protein